MRDDLGALRETQGFPFDHESWETNGVLKTGPMSSDLENSNKLEITLWHIMAEIQSLAMQLDKDFKFLRGKARDDLRLAANKLTRIADEFERDKL